MDETNIRTIAKFKNKINNNKLLNLLKSFFVKYIAIITFIIIWEVLSIVGFFDERFISSFSATFSTLLYLTIDGSLIVNTFYTFLRILIGISLAVLIAIPLGFMVTGFYKKLEKSMYHLFRVLEQFNPYAFFHFLILLIISNELSVILVIFWAALWPLINNTVVGAKNVQEIYIKLARAANFDKFDIFWKVHLRASLPNIFTGLRLSVIFSFLAVFGIEMMGMNTGIGLGYFIMLAQMTGQVPYIWAGIVTTTLLSFVITSLITIIENNYFKGDMLKLSKI